MQSKRIFISLLVVVLLTFCTLTAFAADEVVTPFQVAVSVTSDTAIAGADGLGVQAGDVLDFTVKADENYKGGIYSADLDVTFDPTALELVVDSIQLAEGYNSTNASFSTGAGTIKVSYLSYKAGYQLKGEILSFSFNVLDKHGDTTVTVAFPEKGIADANLEYLDVASVETIVGVHTYGETETVDHVPNDCTAGAEIFRPCTVEGCEAKVILERPNEESHDASGAPADCFNDQICAREGCDAVVAEKLGHDESGAPADCVNDKVCARGCGTVLEPRLGHDESGAPADCFNDKVCARGCGTVLVPKLGHDESGAPADCVNDKVCARGCGTVLAPKLGHDLSGPDPDCVTDKICAREGCGAVIAPKLGHDASGPAADCFNDKVCAREGCGVVLKEKRVHDETGKEATCTTDKVCKYPDCNFVLEERLGHDESGAAATCTAAKICPRCNEVLEAKLAHTYGEWVEGDGVKEKTCSMCGDKITEVLPDDGPAVWLIILIVCLAVVVLGGVGVAVVILLKKKKANAESDETTEENSEEATEEATEAPAEEATEEKTEE